MKIESDSGSGEEDGWQEVGGTKKKGKASPPEHHRGPDGTKLMSKSAKKRARKKRNQSASSEVGDRNQGFELRSSNILSNTISNL